MKKIILLTLILYFTCGFNLYAQDSIPEGKSLNFPTKKYGISLGNSYEFNGLRFNFADQNVRKINGLNVTFWLKRGMNMKSEVNGLSLGVIPTGGTMRILNMGILGVGAANNLSGISFSPGLIGLGGSIYGLSLSGLLTKSGSVNGISLSGLVLSAKDVKGITFGGLFMNSDNEVIGLISSFTCILSKQVKGIALTGGYLQSEIFKGFAIASYSKSTQMNGLSFALFNRTTELNGVQIGLINYAENNRKLLRILPLINFHFKRDQKQLSPETDEE